MIPKIIHYCWLSSDPYPPSIQRCLDSWKEFLPDYELCLWDTNRFDMDSSPWVKEAFEAKKYAFAADYIRLYALYNYGGIYLDSDVIVYKSFNDLLTLPYFVGEDNVHCFEAAIIGCEPGIKWIKDILDRYENLHFVNEDGSYNMRGLPCVFHDMLTLRYKFEKVSGSKSYVYSQEVINVFPGDYFNSRDFVGIIRTKNSYCSHNYMYSWADNKSSKRWKKLLPRPMLNFAYKVGQRLIWDKVVSQNQIPYSL